MRRDPFAHWGSSSMRIVAVLVGLVVLLSPASAQAVPNVLGLYRGFSQSDLDPRLHPSMVVLEVTRQDDKGNFFGTLLMGAPGGQLPFTFQGKFVNDQGGFKGKGTGPAGDVTFTGIIQDLGLGDQSGLLAVGDQGGALVRASYKFTFPDRTVDQGVTYLLRSFPPDPGVPNIIGTWDGTSTSGLTGQQTTLELQITSQELNLVNGSVIDASGVGNGCGGSISINRRLVIICVGDLGRIVVGGSLPPTGGAPNVMNYTYQIELLESFELGGLPHLDFGDGLYRRRQVP